MKKIGIIFILATVIVVFQKNYEENKKIETSNYSEKVLNIEDGSTLEKDFLIFKLNNKFGIMNQSGDIIKNNNYNQVINLDEKIYLLLKDNELIAYNIKKNKELKVEGMSVIGENLYQILKNNKYGIVDSEFNIIVEPINDKIDNNNKRSLIINKNKLEVLDNKTRIKKVEQINNFQQARLGVGNTIYFKRGNKWGVINKNKEIIDAKYDELINLNDKNLLVGYIKDDIYLINIEKNIEEKLGYENYSIEAENAIMVMKQNKIGYIDGNGQEIIPLKYDGGFYFSKYRDFIQLKENGKWKLLNLKTMEQIELPYSDLGEYKDEYMVAEKERKYGYIDKNGEEKIPFKYSIAEDFKDGLGVVASSNGYGVIDKNGREIIPLVYDEIFVSKGYIYGIKNKKVGLFNKEGEEILPLEYDNLGKIENNKILFKKNEKIGIIELNGDKNGN